MPGAIVTTQFWISQPIPMEIMQIAVKKVFKKFGVEPSSYSSAKPIKGPGYSPKCINAAILRKKRAKGKKKRRHGRRPSWNSGKMEAVTSFPSSWILILWMQHVLGNGDNEPGKIKSETKRSRILSKNIALSGSNGLHCSFGSFWNGQCYSWETIAKSSFEFLEFYEALTFLSPLHFAGF